MKVENESATDKIRRHIWLTYKSRYNAHHRILLIDRLQKITITIISIFILSISVLLVNGNLLNSSQTNISNIFMIVLSIILLALSLIIGQSDNKLDAYKLHECARKLHRLYNHIEMQIEKDSNYKVSDEEDQYNDILDQYELNHKKIDWENVIFQEWREHNKCFFSMILFKIKYIITTTGIYFFLSCIPVLVYVLIIRSSFAV